MRLLRPRLPLAGKVFLACSFLTLFVSLPGSIVLYRSASDSLRREVRSKLESTARTAALQIDPDLHRLVRTRADESSSAYRKLKATLIAVRKSNPEIRYVYTMRKSDRENALQFVVDAEEDPKLVSHVGDEYDISNCPEVRKAFFSSAADEKPSEDKWGIWLSGYAPIRDSSGRTEAIVGVDMSLKQLLLEESGLRAAATKNVLVAFLLSVLLSLLITRAVLRLVHTFTRAAQRIRNGDLEFRLDVSSSDEIGVFADAFNHMVAGLKETTRDFLTGLFNHMYLQERLVTEIERAERYKHSMCLLIIDLDRFKSINDAFGHAVGDLVLRQLGAVLRESIRSVDIAARYGGDEFAVILPETDLKAGLEVAERIRATIEQRPFRAVAPDQELTEDFAEYKPQIIKLTVTIGLSAYPEHHHTRDGLVMAADIALSRAKHATRNSVCAYDRTICSEGQVDPHDLYRMLRDPTGSAIQSLAAAVDAKDRYTCGHSERVTSYALKIGGEIGLDPGLLDGLKVAGLLHDLGKIGVPDSILNKPGGLTQEERDAVQLHPSIAENILSRAPQLGGIIPAVLFHHEYWDGTGYPNGLSGEAIPLMARVLAIADAFDAMTSDRPYRRALSPEEALQELKAGAGKQFDPNLVEAFVRAMSSADKKQAA